MGDQIDSLAFRRALLESERRRIYGITAFLLIFAAGIAVRVFLYGSHMSPWGAVALLLVVAYDLLILSAV